MAPGASRVMWLLNHGAARKFEIPMLKRIGFSEIFLPKKIPQDISFRSGTVDFTEDATLTIPQQDLAVLNEANWYGKVSPDIWQVANKHFDILFFISHDPAIFSSVADNFRGAVIWRAYGLERRQTYSKILRHYTGGLRTIEKLGRRFWLGEAYEHLHHIEDRFLRDHAVFLPLGTYSKMEDAWVGDDGRIFFVCPEIRTNSYYREIYLKFKKSFGDLPHAIGGAQPIAVDDPHVLGFLPLHQHLDNMRRLRVIYYQSTEPNHVHYHPFEAIQRGMPLIFRAGGLLDRLGGIGLPGRCESEGEARDKIKRILDGDQELIEAVRRTQTRLLQSMNFDVCEPAWRTGFEKILAELPPRSPLPTCRRKKRVAVILPHAYRGGTLRGAKLTAEALYLGSRQCGEQTEIVFAHLDDPAVYSRQDFDDLPREVSVRAFNWKRLSKAQARRSMLYAGHQYWDPVQGEYAIPDDGIQHLCDCDLWLFISDRLVRPVLPIRPYIVLAFDYLQRYVSLNLGAHNQMFLQSVHAAERVLVTTGFTRTDAIQYAGLSPDRVVQVPMLAPLRSMPAIDGNQPSASEHFIWTTNPAPHKNHVVAFQALEMYYETLGGTLRCHVTGPGVETLLTSDRAHLKPLGAMYAKSSSLKQMVRVVGELSDTRYHLELGSSCFLWHPALIDNGTFSVIEAANLGVPSLASDYPAMRDIDSQFGLNLAFTSRTDPKEIATRLKWMEENFARQRSLLPSRAQLSAQAVENLAVPYWKAVRECL